MTRWLSYGGWLLRAIHLLAPTKYRSRRHGAKRRLEADAWPMVERFRLVARDGSRTSQ
ncbi:hypothetical protein HYDPIDRAFT_117940 [Hydnomerulius pinastri MD-312]|uniref:Uncharacterized protein n=1 Tax=Hydnomerulius pinastri MD-312 TaxID=994086 RepID=A0A0C9W9Y9_9AGAM|nr:hypothetical protein HYDPIDRAFT_117940 [Hydnomerulius pinastri MD-312]